MPRLPKKPQELWDAQKERIRAYYITDRKTLSKTMELMRSEHGFDASKKEYLRRLESWQMSKNLKKGDWKLVHTRSSAKKRTQVLLNDREIDPKRVKRAQGRHKFNTEPSSQSIGSHSSCTRGLMIRTPPSSEGFQVSLTNIPWLQFQDAYEPHVLSMIHRLIPMLDWVDLSGSPLTCCSHGERSMQDARSILNRRILRQFNDDCNTDFTPFIIPRLKECFPRRSNDSSGITSTEPAFLLIQSCIYRSSNGFLTLEDMDQFLTWFLDSGIAPLFNHLLNQLKKVTSPTFEVFLNHLFLSAVHLEKTGLVSDLLKLGIDPNFNNSHCQAEYGRKLFSIAKTFTPLQMAAMKGNFQICQLLVDSGAKVDAVSCSLPFRPLEFAISLNHGTFSIFDLMVTYGADINCSCDDEITRCLEEYMVVAHTKRTLLMKAVKAQNVDITRFLLSRGAPVNEFSEISGTALHIAIENDDLDMINILLQEGAGVNIVDALEISARKYFERHLDSTSMDKGESEVTILARTYYDFYHVKQWSFFLPIQMATARDNVRLVRRLVEAGATLNHLPNWDRIWQPIASTPRRSRKWKYYHRIRDASGMSFRSPLHESVMNGNVELMALLLEHGAAVDSVNASGETPLQLACDFDDQQSRHYKPDLKQLATDMVRLLLSKGANVDPSPGETCGENVPSSTRDTSRAPFHSALHKSVWRKNIELATLLLEHGAAVDSPSASGETPLQLACGLEDNSGDYSRIGFNQLVTDLARLLLSKGANVNRASTALQAAARAGNLNLISLLLHHGAVPTPDIYWIGLCSAAWNNHHHGDNDLRGVGQFGNEVTDFNPLRSGQKFPDFQSPTSVLRDCIRRNSLDVAQMLLDAGADVNMMAEGETALCTALGMGYEDARDLLLSHGANLGRPSSAPTSLATVAVNNLKRARKGRIQAGTGASLPSYALLTHKEISSLVSNLIQDGADINCVTIGGKPLHLAVGRGGIDLVQQLLDRGAEVNTSPSQTYMGHGTALQLAAVHGHFNIARLLIENGADINVPPPIASSVDDARVATALQRAAKLGRMDIVSLLLQNDRDRDMIQVRCKEAAAIATRGGHHVVARILRDYNPLRT
ncbi:ankyrin repeat-containing domain protein [Ilyonectria sp. MPI-CAGE-AT-0026]|nr:ankyrin repeat-containing domain protein [Ilyonectria sp. MPI-CAGE-AT-0026]